MLQSQIESKKYAFDISVQHHVSEELEGKYKDVCYIKAEQEELIKELQIEIDSKDKQIAQKDILLAERLSKGVEQEAMLEELTGLIKKLHS